MRRGMVDQTGVGLPAWSWTTLEDITGGSVLTAMYFLVLSQILILMAVLRDSLCFSVFREKHPLHCRRLADRFEYHSNIGHAEEGLIIHEVGKKGEVCLVRDHIRCAVPHCQMSSILQLWILGLNMTEGLPIVDVVMLVSIAVECLR
jgi:hypothetical protein